MLAADFDAFGQILDQLCACWDRPPAKDELRTAYWHALKDVPLREVRSNAERIMKTAVGKQPFPKPAELRNVAPRESSPAVEATFESAESRCIHNLEELRKADPDAHKREIQRRRLDRILATQHPGSSLYEAAINERHSV